MIFRLHQNDFFSQILSANLKQTHDDIEIGLFGYSVADVKKEIARAAKLVSICDDCDMVNIHQLYIFETNR